MTFDKASNQSGEPPQDEGEQEPVVVRDRRRIDPQTGELRTPPEDGGESVAESISGMLDEELANAVGTEGGEVGVAEAEPASAADPDTAKQVEELTVDLKRVTAEYANYRKRVERDRESVVEGAKASLANELLTVLDDLERAESHGDLTGPFKAVADKLTDSLNSAGLEAFGAEGDEFDPSVHEAVQHSTSSEVSGPTVSTVLRRGYRFGERVLRPAMVAVTDYEPADEGSSQES